MFPVLFSLSTAGIILLATLLRPVRAPCPPVFFAQAISHRQMRQMDFYFTKSGIASAADCANLCGQRHFCQSAVFNHDARSCALSPARPVDCRMVKHRFNTFHLTTDGADALSLLACIHPCQGRQEKLQDQQNGGGGGGFSHLLNIDLGPEGRDSGDPSRKRHREQELFPSPDILPVHDEAGPLVEKQKSGRDEALKKSESGFLGALERLYQMQRRLEEILNEAQRSGHGNGGKEGDAKAGPPEEAKKVRFRAEPLKLTGEFDPTAPEAPNIIPLPPANFSVSSGQLTQTHTLHNGTQVRVHSAGFLARLKPGGRLKLLTAGPGPGFDSSDAGQSAPKQLVQLGRTLAMEIPAQLVTMAPDLFETTASEPASSSAAPFDRNELGGGEAEEPRVSNGRLLGPEAGFLHSLLIHHGKGKKEQGREGERGGETEDEKEQLQKEALSIDAAAPRHSPPSTVVCFRFVQHRRLLHDSGAEIRSERNFSLNQCRCACADTWREGQGRKCKSVRFSQAEGICQLVEADHNQKLDLVVDRSSDYHYVSCELKCYLLRTAEKMCKADTQSKGKESGKEADEASTEPTAFVVNSSTSGAEATTSSVGSPASSRASPPGANLPAAELDQNNHSLEANASGCFERMAGFSLRGTAAGLERGVSQAECECLCANSLRSRMYSFQCVSANYFPADRDCVLNLDSRHSAIEQFGSDHQVTYLGLMCTPEMASQQLAACAWPPTQTNSTSSSPSPPPPSDTSAIAADNSSGSSSSSPAVPPSLSDGCFLEQPGFVLEGLALAVETQVSAAQCKCRCALAERRHGSAVCQSAQFYTESRTCLLNKENRASAPERFSFDSQGADKHSYLDFRCGADKPTLAGYLEANCKEEIAQLSGDDVGMETTTQSAGTETETTTAQLKLLGKGKRRKGRKKGDSTADSATTSASTTAAATEMAPITDPTTPAASTTNRKSAEDESEEEGQQLETRTSVPSSQNVEELSIIPERESSDDAEEHALPGWRTVRVQRGDEPQQAQAVPAAPPAIAAQQQRDDRPESGKEKTAAPTQPPTTVGGASSTTSDTPNISTAAASLSVSAAASNANSSNATSPASSSSSSSFTSTTTTTTTTTTSSEYPPVGQCRFSALYQTVFNGARLLKRLLVDTPAQCLAACHFESCRSANLIQMEDKQKVCELFRDSIVEFRRTDVLSFDRLAVHFDSVQCKPRTE